MKKRSILGAMLLAFALLTGCSVLEGANTALEQANTTLSYAAEAGAFINDANRFAEQVPQLAEQALANPETLEQLRGEMQSMQERIAAFASLQAPEFAADIHRQLTETNEIVRAQLEQYVQQIDAQTIDLAALANAPVLETIRGMTDLLNALEQLGQ
ncbi:DUF6376 family protein [Paenibacillus sp.]|uniref:DUF6376 family protein n=1 Tax=Paenibacillus sp. TaxID=58172 RepID=UPI002D63E38A|nr:DUF6376 family protein [Paenibacillus sp.]HZG83466.1 DUF6376 family protein [Paenibacillus sp.]